MLDRKMTKNSEYDEGYKLNMAEFKGSVIQNLVDIRLELVNASGERKELRTQIWAIKLVSTVIGGIAGLIVTLATLFVSSKP